MTDSKHWLIPAIAMLFVALVSCSKGGTSIDQDAHKPRETPQPQDEMPCGNGAIDEGEDCDGDMMGDVTCANLGFEGGMLSCDPITCTYETTMCRLPATQGTAGTGSGGS